MTLSRATIQEKERICKVWDYARFMRNEVSSVCNLLKSALSMVAVSVDPEQQHIPAANLPFQRYGTDTQPSHDRI